MSDITIHLPHSLQRTIQSLAAKEGYSVDQFLASAAAEKIAALRAQAAAGRREDFDRFLAAVPDQPPAESDLLPD